MVAHRSWYESAFHDQVLNAWDPSITSTVGAMSPEEIFRAYARSIGIGGIAMAGIIGIIKSWASSRELSVWQPRS